MLQTRVPRDPSLCRISLIRRQAMRLLTVVTNAPSCFLEPTSSRSQLTGGLGIQRGGLDGRPEPSRPSIRPVKARESLPTSGYLPTLLLLLSALGRVGRGGVQRGGGFSS